MENHPTCSVDTCCRRYRLHSSGHLLGAPLFGKFWHDQIFIVNSIGFEDEPPFAPIEFSLEQNFPNPFNSATDIRFEISRESLIRSIIVDLWGHLNKMLVNDTKQPDIYSISWDGKDDSGVILPSGV
jgi:hypothetical protein